MRHIVAIIVTAWLLLGGLPQANDVNIIGHTERSARESFGAKNVLALSVFCDLSNDGWQHTCWDPVTGDRYLCTVGRDPDSGNAYGDCSPVGHGGVSLPPPSQDWCDLHPNAPRCREQPDSDSDPEQPKCEDEVIGPDGKCQCPDGEVRDPDGKCTKRGCGDTASNVLGSLATKLADDTCPPAGKPTRTASFAPLLGDSCAIEEVGQGWPFDPFAPRKEGLDLFPNVPFGAPRDRQRHCYYSCAQVRRNTPLFAWWVPFEVTVRKPLQLALGQQGFGEALGDIVVDLYGGAAGLNFSIACAELCSACPLRKD
jgi:hypothetical protein